MTTLGYVQLLYFNSNFTVIYVAINTITFHSYGSLLAFYLSIISFQDCSSLSVIIHVWLIVLLYQFLAIYLYDVWPGQTRGSKNLLILDWLWLESSEQKEEGILTFNCFSRISLAENSLYYFQWNYFWKENNNRDSSWKIIGS